MNTIYRQDPTMGNCFTFNMNANRSVNRAGPIYGLRIIFKTNVTEYMPTASNVGMVVQVHDQVIVVTHLHFNVNCRVNTRFPTPLACTYNRTLPPNSDLTIKQSADWVTLMESVLTLNPPTTFTPWTTQRKAVNGLTTNRKSSVNVVVLTRRILRQKTPLPTHAMFQTTVSNQYTKVQT